MRGDPLALYTRARAEFGDYFRIRIVPHTYCYVLTHPDAVEQILHTNHKNYRKPDIFYRSLGLLVGDGLFTNEGESWARQRKLAAPAFQTAHLEVLSPVMVQGAEEFVREQTNNTGTPIDMCDAMMKVGLRIASTTLFSADISGEADRMGKAFRVAFSHISKRLNSLQLLPSWVPTKSNRQFRAAKTMLDKIVLDLILARRKSGEKPHDLLGMLMAAHDETGHGMPDRLLMDEALTLLTGGHENIGSALTWTWYLLGKHPKIQEDVYDEINAVLRGRSPTAAAIKHLPLTRAVFEESMRLYPPGWGELREAVEPDEIAGYEIPKKAMIILCQWVTHRHPDFWQDPETFNPHRFLGAQPPGGHRFAYFPFGGGARICIGMQMAYMEGVLVLATILQHFRAELVPDHAVEPDATFTLRPRYGLKMILYPRQPRPLD
jgi:cytochrome P450